MSRKKVAPEIQIIALFGGLSDEGKRMVMFALNAMSLPTQETPRPKSVAPSAVKRSSRNGAGAKSIQNLETETVSATDAAS